jgi:23S rRNA-intervening sequence protein
MKENSSPSRERERVEGRSLTLVKLKNAYKDWLALYRNFPKVERFGIGQKIERAFLDALELVFLSSFAPRDQKLPILTKANTRMDVVKFFLQIAWEQKLLATAQYSALLPEIEEVGKMLYGWKKGLERKTPPA